MLVYMYLHIAPALKLLKRSWFVSLWLAVGKDVRMPAGEV